MHSTSDQESAHLMAQWLATGGAGPQTDGEMPAGDDGLKAAPTATGAYGCGFADDGLTASMLTRRLCIEGETPAGNDGLAAR